MRGYVPEAAVFGSWPSVFSSKSIALALYLSLLTGCASELQIPKKTLINVPVPCLSPADKPQRPALLTDGEILALDTYRATWALWGDRLELLGYTSKLEAVVEGCSRISAVKP